MTSYSALRRQTKRSITSSSISQVQVNLEHVLGFTSMSNSAVSQNHSTIAYAAGSSTVLYNKDTQKQDFVINTTRKTITSLSISPDGRYLATGESGHKPKVRVWDLNGDRKSCIELGDHEFSIDSVCFSPKGNRLVSIGSLHDGNVYVWSWQYKKKLTSNKCLCSIRRVAFAENGHYFVTVGNRHVKFWYLISRASINHVSLSGHDALLGARKNHLFTDVVCGRGICAGLTYTVTTNGFICQFDEHRNLRADRNLEEKTNCLAISDSYIAVGCDKGVVYILSPQSLEPITSIRLPHHLGVDIGSTTSVDPIRCPQQSNIAFPDTIAICLDEAKSLITCFYNDHSFYICDIKNERSIEKRNSHMYHSGCVWAIETYSLSSALSSSNPHQLPFITCSSDDTVRFWSLNNNTPDLCSVSLQVANIGCKQLTKIVYLDEDCSNLCHRQTTQESYESASKVGGRCMKMAPDGLSLAIGDRSGNIRIFDMQTFRQTAFIEAHVSDVLSIDYGQSTSMNVTFLASSSRDRFIHIFEASRDYQLVTTLDDHTGAVTAIRFTFSSETSKLQLITCSTDKSMIFRTISKNEDGKYQFLRSHNIFEKQTFYDLTVDHSHEHIHTACQDRMIRVYNTADGKRVRVSKGSVSDNAGYLIKIDIDASGRYIATSCSNKCVYVWDTITSKCIASLCGHSEIVTDLKFSHDGSHLYTTASDRSLSALSTSVNEAQEDMPIFDSTSENTQSETIGDMTTKAIASTSSSNSKTCDVNSQTQRVSSGALLGVPMMSTSKNLTESRSTQDLTSTTTSVQQPTSTTLNHVQLGPSTETDQTIESRRHPSAPDLSEMQQEQNVSSLSVARPTFNNTEQDFIYVAFLEIIAIIVLFYNNELNKHSLIHCTLIPTFVNIMYDMCVWLSAFIAIERVLIEFFHYSLYRTRKYSVIFLIILFLFHGSGSVIKAFGRTVSKSPVLSTTFYVCSFNDFSNKKL
ncbi:unnamed protein product, partial [Rotaria sordida]